MPTDTTQEKRPRGRPEGAVSKLAKEAVAKAKETGALPHEILLGMARGDPQPVKTAKLDEDTGEVVISVVGWEVLDIDQRRDAAKAAAPYFAPKISTVEVIAGVTDSDLDQLIAQLAQEAGIGLGPDGEIQEGEEGTGTADGDGTPPGLCSSTPRVRKRPQSGT